MFSNDCTLTLSHFQSRKDNTLILFFVVLFFHIIIQYNMQYYKIALAIASVPFNYTFIDVIISISFLSLFS